MANIALSEAEKTFILHGVEVFILYSNKIINLQLCYNRKISAVMADHVEIIDQWS